MSSTLEPLNCLADAFESYSSRWPQTGIDTIQSSGVETIIKAALHLYAALGETASVRCIFDTILSEEDYSRTIMRKNEALLYRQWALSATRYEITIQTLRDNGQEIRGADQFLGCIRDAKRNYEVWQSEQDKAVSLRAAWMRAAGLPEAEIAEYCDPENYPADLTEEQQNLVAQAEMAQSRPGV